MTSCKRIIIEANNSHDADFLILVEQMCKTKLDATKRYGQVCGTLGSKGLFCDLNRKYQRIKRWVWEGQKEATSENIEDALFDNAIYSLLMIMELRQEKRPEYP